MNSTTSHSSLQTAQASAPTLAVRKASERGHFNHGWLKTWHTFSFSEYFDPKHVQFRSLRVINEDIVAAGQGFGTHGHRDMEIITYPLAGSLEHRDSLGNGGVLQRDRIQRMRAGTGIRHSEFNPDAEKPLHLFQIWLLPKVNGLPPAYEDRSFDPALAQGKWQLLVSPDGAEGSLDMAQDAHLWRAFLQAGEEVSLKLPEGENYVFLQLASGEVEVAAVGEGNGTVNPTQVSARLAGSDAAALSQVREVKVKAVKAAEVLLFGLA